MYQHHNGVRLQASVILSTLLTFVLAASCFSQEAWQTFSPKSGEFSVEMPPDVKVQQQTKDGLTVNVYTANEGDLNCVIMGGVSVATDDKMTRKQGREEFIQGLESSALPKDSSVKSKHVETSGSGWDGTDLLLQQDGKNISQIRVAHSTLNKPQVFYTLVINAPQDDPQAKRFLSSFKIDNAKLPGLYKQAYGGRSFAYKVGYTIGGLVLFIVPIALIIGIIVVVIRKNAVKKTEGGQTK